MADHRDAHDPQFDQVLAKAKSLATQGKYVDAIRLYDQLIAHDPQHLESYQQVAILSEKIGDIPKAVNTHTRWAAECDRLGMHDEALKLYGQVLAVGEAATSPDKKALFKNANVSPERIAELIAQWRPEIELQMGRIYLQKKLADEAIQHLKAALDSSQDYRVHTLLGIAYMQKSWDKEAIGEFQEVVRLAPSEAAFAYEKLGEIFLGAGKPTTSTIVWFRNAGDLYLRNENYDDAVRAYEMILSFEQRNKEVLTRLAEIYTQQGMREKALATWRKLAQLYTEEGLLDKVIILYEKLSDLDPHDEESRTHLLDIYRSILQRDGSNLTVRIKLIKALIAHGNTDELIPEYMALATSYFEKGVLDEAGQVVQKLLDIDPRNPKARELMGDIHMKRDEKESALSQYLEVLKTYTESGDEERRHAFNQKLMSIFPQESGVHYEMARSLKEQGSYDEALSEIQKILEQDPDHVQALSDASDILATMSRGSEARALYLRILELDPQRIDVRVKLFESYIQSEQLEDAIEQVEHVAAALQERGLLRDAEMLYRRMLNYYPDSADIRLRICQLCLEQGEIDSVLHDYLLLANMFVRRRMLDRAAEMYAMILRQRPDHFRAHHRLGRVLAELGNTSQALGHFAHLVQEYLKRNLTLQALNVLYESIELAPNRLDLRQRLVELLVRHRRMDEATEQYKHLIGQALQAGHVDEARQHTAEVLSLQPQHLDLRFDLACTYLEANKLDDGQALLEGLVAAYRESGQHARVLDIYARMAPIYRSQEKWDRYWQVREQTAALLLQQGRKADAMVLYRDIVDEMLRAGNLQGARNSFSTLAELYGADERADEAMGALERMTVSLTREGNLAAAQLAQELLVELMEKKGDRGQAVQLLLGLAEKAQASQEGELALILYGRVFNMYTADGRLEEASAVQFICIRLLLGMGDLDRARLLFAELHRRSAQDQAQFAELLYQYEYFEEALPLFVEIVGREPANVEAKARLSVMYARRGEMSGAAALARGLLACGMLDRILSEFAHAERAAGDGTPHLRCGSFYEELGFYEEALQQYQQAAKHSALRLEALNRMASLFGRAGYADLAIRQYCRILEQPGFNDADLLETRYNLACFYQDEQRLQDALSMFNECSAIRLRYKDVARRVEELSSRIAAGATARADVIPINASPSVALVEGATDE